MHQCTPTNFDGSCRSAAAAAAALSSAVSSAPLSRALSTSCFVGKFSRHSVPLGVDRPPWASSPRSRLAAVSTARAASSSSSKWPRNCRFPLRSPLTYATHLWQLAPQLTPTKSEGFVEAFLFRRAAYTSGSFSSSSSVSSVPALRLPVTVPTTARRGLPPFDVGIHSSYVAANPR